jgi:hypothetical protein
MINLTFSQTPAAKGSKTVLSAQQVENNGVKIIVSLPEKITASSIPLTLSLSNQTQSEHIHCGATGYFIDCRIKIRTVDDKPVAYTRLGNGLFGEGYKRYPRSQYWIPEIARGRSFHWDHDLRDVFEPLATGNYLLSLETDIYLSWRKSGAETVTLEATDIPFEVQ